MRPVDQTVLHGEKKPGNCYAACLASLLEVDLSDIPAPDAGDFDSWDNYWPKLHRWAVERGFFIVDANGVGEEGRTSFVSSAAYGGGGYWIASGPGPRGVFHAVVMRDLEMVHDPHPDRAGLEKITSVSVLVPLDPSDAGRSAVLNQEMSA